MVLFHALSYTCYTAENHTYEGRSCIITIIELQHYAGSSKVNNKKIV